MTIQLALPVRHWPEAMPPGWQCVVIDTGMKTDNGDTVHRLYRIEAGPMTDDMGGRPLMKPERAFTVEGLTSVRESLLILLDKVADKEFRRRFRWKTNKLYPYELVSEELFE